MTTPTDTEMIRDVAEGLGWEPYALGYRVNGSVANLEAETGLLAFAAYVMAAMAGREVFTWIGGSEIKWSTDWWCVEMGSDRNNGASWQTGEHLYDPTDPASWAMAVIRCAWEALKGGNDGTQS